MDALLLWLKSRPKLESGKYAAASRNFFGAIVTAMDWWLKVSLE